MNKISLVSFALSLASATAFAAPQAANQYDCQAGDLSIRFSATSKTGKPTLTVQKGKAPAQTFADVKPDASRLGVLLTVGSQYIPDLESVEQRILLPAVNLLGDEPSAEFDTLLLTTTHHTSFAGPVMVRGALSETVSEPAHCVAQYVAF